MKSRTSLIIVKPAKSLVRAADQPVPETVKSDSKLTFISSSAPQAASSSKSVALVRAVEPVVDEILGFSEVIVAIDHMPCTPPAVAGRSARTQTLHQVQYTFDPEKKVLISNTFGAEIRNLRSQHKSFDRQGTISCKINFEIDQFVFRDVLPGNMTSRTSLIIVKSAKLMLIRWKGTVGLRLDNIIIKEGAFINFLSSLIASNVVPDLQKNKTLLQTVVIEDQYWEPVPPGFKKVQLYIRCRGPMQSKTGKICKLLQLESGFKVPPSAETLGTWKLDTVSGPTSKHFEMDGNSGTIAMSSAGQQQRYKAWPPSTLKRRRPSDCTAH